MDTVPPPGLVTELTTWPLRNRLTVEPARTPVTVNTGLRALVMLSPNRPVSVVEGSEGDDEAATLVTILTGKTALIALFPLVSTCCTVYWYEPSAITGPGLWLEPPLKSVRLTVPARALVCV